MADSWSWWAEGCTGMRMRAACAGAVGASPTRQRRGRWEALERVQQCAMIWWKVWHL